MKVKLNETYDIDDKNRKYIADVLDRKQTKREATREETRQFLLERGSHWEEKLNTEWNQRFGEPSDDLL